ncbi:unnamed protein product, partial [Symbiodinium pilosum]
MLADRRRRGFGHCLCLLVILLGVVLPASTPPLWWRKGRPREILGSRAEAELLSQLAVLLMPDEPIAELFRNFPCERCQDWGSSTLSPDLAAYGVLRKANAALFIEYDGHYRHLAPAGLTGDMRKTEALLRFAPAGSLVVRIAHEQREWEDRSVNVVVDCWPAGHGPSLLRALRQVGSALLQRCSGKLRPFIASRLQNTSTEEWVSKKANTFSRDAAIAGVSERSGNSSRRLKLQEHFQDSMQLTASKTDTVIAKFPRVLGLSIEANLKPTVESIKGLGLNQRQVAKVIATFPPVLGLGIEANLKPTVEWIKGLGLNQRQVAKVIATFPPVLGLSIEANLKPTVEWIKGLGLSQTQVAKVIMQHPQVLGLSIKANLKPTVEWIKGLGLSQTQVAKVIMQRPHALGLSIEANLKPTVEWIKGLGLNQRQVAKVIATFPPVLGLSIEANLKPTVEWIKGLGLSQTQVAKVIMQRPQTFGYSIEANLKPTVEWIKGLGLSQQQVAKVIATFPPVLGLSIEANLKPTVEWIKGLGLSQRQVAKVIATFSPVLGYSIEPNLSIKYLLLQQYFPGQQAANCLARVPRLWSYSRARLQHRLHVLQSQ